MAENYKDVRLCTHAELGSEAVYVDGRLRRTLETLYCSDVARVIEGQAVVIHHHVVTWPNRAQNWPRPFKNLTLEQ